jgi:hypothetical protein
LLQGKVNGTVLSPGGRVPIGRKETLGERQEWYVIIINTRTSVAPSNEQKSEHAAALKLWGEELAKAEEEKTEFTKPQPLIGDYGELANDAYINIMYGNAASLAVSVVSGVLGLLLLA